MYKKWQVLLASRNIEWLETSNTVKALIVERFNQTLKDKMNR